MRYPGKLSTLLLIMTFGGPTASIAAVDTPPYAPSLRPDAGADLIPGVDWAGPDGVVYPDFSRVGVGNGAGIPDLGSWSVLRVEDGYDGQDEDGDLTAELRQALDDAGMRHRSEGTPGCIVELPAGDWVLSGPLVVEDDGILIRGAGSDRTRISLDAPITRSDRDRPIDEVDPPLVDCDPYDGVVHRFSSVVVLVDPRYDYKDSRWDDPGAPLWRRYFPRNTVAEVRLYLHDPDTGDRVSDDDGEVYLKDTGLRNGDMTSAWRLDKFAKWHEYLQHTVMLQPEVHYDDGTVLTGELTSFPADWDASPDFKRSANGTAAWFVFAGDEWSHRGDEVPLTRPARRGDTLLHLQEDVRTRTEPDFGVVGDLLRVQIYGDKDLPYKDHTGASRKQVVSIAGHDGSDGDGGFMVRINEPLRFDFPLEEGGQQTTAHARLQLPWRRGGIEGITFDYANDVFLGLVTTNTILQDFWLRDLQVNDAPSDALWFGAKNLEVHDCHFTWTRWPDQGSTSYIGGSFYDSLIDGITAIGFRHAPNLHGGVNVVVRGSWFDLSDAQMHAGNGIDLLYEQLRVRADGRGSYGNALTIREWDESQGGGAADRLVVFGCDLYGPQYGVDFGGRNEAMVFAYNRIQAGSRSLFQLQDGSFDHIIIGNTLIGDNRFEPVFQMGADDHANSGLHNTGVHFIGNRIHGSNGELSAAGPGVSGASDIARSEANRYLPIDGTVGMPSAPAGFIDDSLYQTQRAHPDGLTPDAEAIYSPDGDAGPDQHRSEGDVIAQVNFGPAETALPPGWLVDEGDDLAERNGHRYGWSAGTDANPRLDTYGAHGPRYLSSCHFGDDDDGEWSIELPAGTYDVFLALGRPRDQDRNDYSVLYPLEPGDIRVWNHSIRVNDRTWSDEDHLRDEHPLSRWQAGLSDAGDKMDGAWVSGVTVEDSGDGTGLLTLSAAAETNGLGIQFIQIHEHQGLVASRRIEIDTSDPAMDPARIRLESRPTTAPELSGETAIFGGLIPSEPARVLFPAVLSADG